MIPAADITGIVLAGGLGSRMGGVDKGLQGFRGAPLVQHALQRLRPQVGTVMINANRHLEAYAAFGVPVWPDALPGYPGPLAGFLAGLEHCETPWLLTVPCDTPLFPLALAERLSARVEEAQAAIGVASSAGQDGALRTHPVFCLMRRDVMASLAAFMDAGGRKVMAWIAQSGGIEVPFDRPEDAGAFSNANTVPELQELQQS